VIFEKKTWVNQNIDKKIFEDLKEKEYNKDVDDDEKQLLFKDNLKHEYYGKYNGISIESDVFKNFNNNYTHMTTIEDCYKNFDESILQEYLKDILEDEKNVIYKKYKDEELSSAQFDSAYEQIYYLNEKKKKHIQNQHII